MPAESEDRLPTFALERDTTMPVQTDLALRLPEVYEKAEFKIEDYTVEIKKQASKNEIRITRKQHPASGVELKIKKKAGRTVKIKTDENGYVAF